MVITGLSSVKHYFNRKQESLCVQILVPLPLVTCLCHCTLVELSRNKSFSFLFLFTYWVARFLLPCVFYLSLYKHSLYINIQSYTFLHIVIFIYFHLLSFLFISRITELATTPIMQFCLLFSYFCAGSLLHPKLSVLIMLLVLCL